jgi:hypothetical protein
MLIPQTVQCELRGRQGRPHPTFAELRRELAMPSTLSGGHRRRLLDLARQLARVQTLGDGYARVCLSPQARAAVEDQLPSA